MLVRKIVVGRAMTEVRDSEIKAPDPIAFCTREISCSLRSSFTFLLDVFQLLHG